MSSQTMRPIIRIRAKALLEQYRVYPEDEKVSRMLHNNAQDSRFINGHRMIVPYGVKGWRTHVCVDCGKYGTSHIYYTVAGDLTTSSDSELVRGADHSYKCRNECDGVTIWIME